MPPKDPLRNVSEARDALEAAQAAYRRSLFEARSAGLTVRVIAKAARVSGQAVSAATRNSDLADVSLL